MRRLTIMAVFGVVVLLAILAGSLRVGSGGLSGAPVRAASTQDGPRTDPNRRPGPRPDPQTPPQPPGSRDVGGGFFEIVLAAPVAWGDWTGARFCPEGMYVLGIEQRVEPFQGADRDDAGTTGVRFGCGGPGSVMSELPSPPGVAWGDWTGAQFCPEGMYVSGIEQRVEPYQGPDRDDAAMTGLRFGCSGSGSAMSELPSPPGVAWGDWTGAQFCPEGMYVSGIEQRIEPFQGADADDAGMTGLRFFCRASR